MEDYFVIQPVNSPFPIKVMMDDTECYEGEFQFTCSKGSIMGGDF